MSSMEETLCWVSIDTLKEWEHNPRKNDKAVPEVARSIERFGFASPIVAREDGTIIAGHTRYKAAISLGLTEVPVHYVSLSSDDAALLSIADNRLGEIATWDNQMLGDLLLELKNEEVNLEGIGLDDEEVKGLLRAASVRQKEGEHEADEFEEEDVPTIAQRGAVYRLGPHVIMCGDCTDDEDVRTLFSFVDSPVDCLVTDPPYGVDYEGKNSMLQYIGKGRNKAGINNDAIHDYRSFICLALEGIPWAEKNTAYIFSMGQRLVDFHEGFTDAGLTWSDYLIWVKNHIVLSRKDYNPKHEFIIYGWHGTHEFHGGTKTSTILEYDKPQKSEEHPTMKPEALIERLITDGSVVGDVVYDPFLGSGTTLVCCNTTRRACVGMEIEPHYVDVAIARLEKAAGHAAIRIK